MEYLSVGMNVNIKRSDGRVHDALISAVNVPAKSVTVEWFEKGETKGKEIELDQLLVLNPSLGEPPMPSDSPPAKDSPERTKKVTNNNRKTNVAAPLQNAKQTTTTAVKGSICSF